MTQPTPLLILGSSSPARRALMLRLQIPFTAESPDIDESPLENESVTDLVSRLAVEKAKKIAETHPRALIIGCDQVGILDNDFLTKPITHNQAIKQLQAMSDKTIRFYTGMCVYDARNDTMQQAIETYDVHFRTLTLAMIESYLQKEKPYHCAGSFQAEGLGITLIERFQGDDFTALVGLPLIRLTQMLESAGIAVL